jgi:hypothetical protein
MNIMAIEDRLRPKPPLQTANRIVYTTEARGVSAIARAADEERKRIEAQRDAELATALSQPHRLGDYGTKRESALGRFCEDYRPRPLGDHLYRAGVRYGHIIGEAKTAQGFPVPGYEPAERGYWEACAKANCDKRDPRSSICLCAAQARKELALMRQKDANAILTAALPGLPWQLYRLCFESIDPSPLEAAACRKGLMALSDAWGMTPKSDMRP